MQTVILLGLVSLLTDISSEMVYPLLSLYLTTTLGATPVIIGGFLWRIIGPSATFHFGCIMGILAALGMFLVVPKLEPDAFPCVVDSPSITIHPRNPT